MIKVITVLVVSIMLFSGISCANKGKVVAAQMEIQTPPKDMITKNPNSNLFETVYFQKWVGGLEATGNGFNVHFITAKPLSNSIEILKVRWKDVEVLPEKINETEYVAHFFYNLNSDQQVKQNPLNDTTEFFLTYNNEKDTFIEIYSNLKEKPMIAYPSMEKPKN